jgi:hypothetical protein
MRTSRGSCASAFRAVHAASALSERTIAALAAAKARGQALGNPKLAEARAIANANDTAGAEAFADGVAPAIREAQAAGAKTLRQIAAALNHRGIGTAGRKVGAAGGRERASTDRVSARADAPGEKDDRGNYGMGRREGSVHSGRLKILEEKSRADAQNSGDIEQVRPSNLIDSRLPQHNFYERHC